jgi:hypothetical protein
MADDPQAGRGSAAADDATSAISPLPHEDPQIHLDVLTTFMNSTEFEGLEPQLAVHVRGPLHGDAQQFMQHPAGADRCTAPG